MADYNLNQLNVSIKEVAIGNKKLTKSIFNQIEAESCFDENIEFIGDAIIGYVKDKNDRYLLWVSEGKLRKSRLTFYYNLKTNVERASLDATSWFLRKTKIKFVESDDFKDRLSESFDDHDQYIRLVEKAHEFLDSLDNKQVFL